MTRANPLHILFHPTVFPETVRQGLLSALRGGTGDASGPRHIPGPFLYQSPAQAGRWLNYHHAFAPSRTDGGLQKLYEKAFLRAIDHTMGRSAVPGGLRYVSLGCGGGRKDREFITAYFDFRGRGGGPVRGRPPLSYFPLDASAALVMESLLVVGRDHPDLEVHALSADLAAAPELETWMNGDTGKGRERPALLSCFGMVPNLDPEQFPAYVAGLLKKGDALLISANLSPGGRDADAGWVLPQYDNPPARAWYGGALAELGLSADTVELRVQSRRIGGRDDIWRVQVTAQFLRDFTLHLFESEIRFARGEILEVLTSNRFSAPALESILRRVGLEPVERWLMTSGEEGIWLCQRG